MKKLLLFFMVTSLLTACHQKKEGEIIMVTPEQVANAVTNEKNIQLLDVRTTDEYTVKHLKNAQNICVTSDDFKEKVAQLDKDKPVYVYCKKGGRSAQSALILKEMGFTKVYDLQGGLDGWEEHGFETVN